LNVAVCRVCCQPDEGAASSAAGCKPSASGATVAPSPSIGGGGGDMMSEMANRLRARKAKADAEMNAHANVREHQPCRARV